MYVVVVSASQVLSDELNRTDHVRVRADLDQSSAMDVHPLSAVE